MRAVQGVAVLRRERYSRVRNQGARNHNAEMRHISSVCKTFQMRAVLERRGLGDGSVLSVRDQAQTQA